MNRIKMKTTLLMILAMVFFSTGIANSKTGGVFYCNGKSANVGQTMDEVKASIGAPDRIEEDKPQDQSQTGDQYQTPPSNNIKWIYKCESMTYVFLFKDETLISIYQIKDTE